MFAKKNEVWVKILKQFELTLIFEYILHKRNIRIEKKVWLILVMDLKHAMDKKKDPLDILCVCRSEKSVGNSHYTDSQMIEKWSTAQMDPPL